MKRYHVILFRASFYPFLALLVAVFGFLQFGRLDEISENLNPLASMLAYSIQGLTALLFVTLPVFCVMMAIAFIQTWRDREIGQNVLYCIMALFFNFFAPYLFYFHLKSQRAKNGGSERCPNKRHQNVA